MAEDFGRGIGSLPSRCPPSSCALSSCLVSFASSPSTLRLLCQFSAADLQKLPQDPLHLWHQRRRCQVPCAYRVHRGLFRVGCSEGFAHSLRYILYGRILGQVFPDRECFTTVAGGRSHHRYYSFWVPPLPLFNPRVLSALRVWLL